MSADRLAAEVRDYFSARAEHFGLHPDAVDVRYVPNVGGFVNYSFRVSDGTRDLHCKLAVHPETRASLERWHGLGDALERYRAPRILDRVEIGGASGLLFAALAGATPSPSVDVLGPVLECVRGLWSDRSIATRLPRRDGCTAATCYLETYHDRFTEDLAGIRADLPPFLSRRDLDFMAGEAERLRRAVEAEPAFGESMSSPVHADLWLNNVVWESRTSWHIVDWDDLRIGDPAMDVAMLTGPTPDDPAPLKHLESLELSLPRACIERLPLLGRASLLDWAIDPLADWVEARVLGPDERTEARREKERVHARALALYRELYVDGS